MSGRYIIGVDMGANRVDPTVIVVLDAVKKEVVAQQLAQFTTIRDFVNKVVATSREYAPRSIWLQNIGLGVVASEELMATHDPDNPLYFLPVRAVNVTAKSKEMIVSELKRAIESKQIRLIEHVRDIDDSPFLMPLALAWYGLVSPLIVDFA